MVRLRLVCKAFRAPFLFRLLCPLFLLMSLSQLFGQPLEGGAWDDAYLDLLAAEWPGNGIENVIWPSGEPSVENREFDAGSIRIVQLGDSHLQAGISAHALRESTQALFPQYRVPLGYAFPFRAAGTHDATRCRTFPSGGWRGGLSVKLKKSTAYGLAGAYVDNTDPSRSLFFQLLRTAGDPVDTVDHRVQLFYQPWTSSVPWVNGRAPDRLDTVAGVADFILPSPLEQIEVRVKPKEAKPAAFRLLGYAITYADALDQIVFYCAGHNGADLEAYLRNETLHHQLQNVNPHVVIVSLGTNDAYSTSFTPEAFAQRLTEMVRLIRNAVPASLIVLATPNDHLFRRGDVNYRVSEASEVIRATALETGCALWDFNRIMGGAGSIYSWLNNGLAAKDGLHFSPVGYRLQGRLLAYALADLIEQIDRAQRLPNRR